MIKMSLRDRKLLTRGIHLIIMNNDMFHWADFVDIFNIKKTEFMKMNGAGKKIYDIIIQNQELIKEEILNSEYYKSMINVLTKEDILLKIKTEKQDKLKLMSDRELLEEIYRLLTK